MLKVKKLLGAMLLFGVFGLAFFPNTTQAGLIPCASTEHPEPCTLCHLLIGFKVLIDYGLSILIYVAIAGIVASGVMYILVFTDEGLVKKAKEMLTGTLKGFAFVISGWLIINVIFWVLSANVDVGLTGKSWYQFECDTTSSVSGSSAGAGATGAGATTGASLNYLNNCDHVGKVLVGALVPAGTCPAPCTLSGSTCQ